MSAQYLRVTYVTIDGAAGSARVWDYELVDWLAKRPGALIVKLEVLP